MSPGGGHARALGGVGGEVPPQRASGRRLRILHLVGYPYLTRGTAIQAFLLAREQRRQGHEVTCAFAYSGVDGGARRLQPVSDADIELDLYAMESRREMLRFRHTISSGRFDVIHAHYRDRALRFALLSSVAVRTGALVASWGNVYPIDPRRWLSTGYRDGNNHRSYSAWTGLVLRAPRVSRIVAVARTVKQVLVETGGVRPEKVSVAYEGVDPTVFHPSVDGAAVREELGLPHRAPVVGIASAYYWVKDYPTFLRAAAVLGARDPEVRFLIVGEGTERIWNSVLRDHHALASRIVVAGARSDMPQVLAAMDVLVSTSRYEALSGVAREALAMSKPVVCSDVGGNGELVRQGESGWLFPAGDWLALADTITTVLANPAMAARTAAVGRTRVLETHTLEARRAAIDGLYVEALDGRLW